MANIGTFTKTDNGFVGEIVTLTFRARNVRLIPETNGSSEHARSGEGPYILEMQTYRYRGHSMSDPAKYRTKEEVDKYRNERDPIDHVRKILLEEKMTDEAALKAVDADIRKIVNDAAEFAQHSPEPDPSELWTDVLVGA